MMYSTHIKVSRYLQATNQERLSALVATWQILYRLPTFPLPSW